VLPVFSTLPLRLQEFLELITGTTDGEALRIQEVRDTPNHQHFMMLVIPTIAASLDRPKLREFLLPVPKHMRLDIAQLANFTDREVAFGWYGRE
jgi:hypothetical protein